MWVKSSAGTDSSYRQR